MVGEHLAQTILPGEDLRPVWRAACVAYREVRRTGARDEPAWKAARAAVLQEFPTLSERAAGEQASDAICYVAVYYPQWLWKGVGEAAEFSKAHFWPGPYARSSSVTFGPPFATSTQNVCRRVKS